MKKKFGLIFLAALLLLLTGTALGETAADLTKQCTFHSLAKRYLYRLTDGKINVPYEGAKKREPWISVETPADQPAYGVYVIWPYEGCPVVVESWNEGTNAWEEVIPMGVSGIAHEYAALPGLTKFRFRPTNEEGALKLCELKVLGKGDVPDTVQVWRPIPDKVDLMILSAHPDDEHLFMGGVMSHYANQGLQVEVVYLTYHNDKRLHELLNGLWIAGVRNYPIVYDFRDRYTASLKRGYDLWGRENVLDKVQQAIERLRPEVVVTHDVEGEYGHGAHRVCGDSCLTLIRDEERPLAWRPKKLYLHLWKENPLVMDFRQPLENLGGQTALELAKEGFKAHVSQQGYDAPLKNGVKYKFRVEDEGMFSIASYGLAYSAVGVDTVGGDMFENIGEELLTTANGAAAH